MIQLDGCKNNSNSSSSQTTAFTKRVLLIGCTNCPWDIDDAIMRRFQRRIYIPLPDPETRNSVLQSLLHKSAPHSVSTEQLRQLVEKTEGYSCSDLTSVASDAAFGPLRSVGGIKEISIVHPSDIRPVNYKDYLIALQNYPKSLSETSLQRYTEWEKKVESEMHINAT
jgi:SpoVK/Ycf46/Vps4 family AAA+-type ATPase